MVYRSFSPLQKSNTVLHIDYYIQGHASPTIWSLRLAQQQGRNGNDNFYKYLRPLSGGDSDQSARLIGQQVQSASHILTSRSHTFTESYCSFCRYTYLTIITCSVHWVMSHILLNKPPQVNVGLIVSFPFTSSSLSEGNATQKQ